MFEDLLHGHGLGSWQLPRNAGMLRNPSRELFRRSFASQPTSEHCPYMTKTHAGRQPLVASARVR